MQNAEIEIAAANVSEAIEAGINQTAEKYGVDEIQVKRYGAYKTGRFLSTEDEDYPVYRVSLDFIADPALFDNEYATEGYIDCE